MQLKDAKAEAEELLRPFVGEELTTEVLNTIENTINGLIVKWAQASFFVQDDAGNLVRGIKIWYDLFNGDLRFAFRYPSQTMNMRKQ